MIAVSIEAGLMREVEAGMTLISTAAEREHNPGSRVN